MTPSKPMTFEGSIVVGSTVVPVVVGSVGSKGSSVGSSVGASVGGFGGDVTGFSVAGRLPISSQITRLVFSQTAS